MSNENENKEPVQEQRSDKKAAGVASALRPRAPKAAFVWLAILLGIGILVLFKGYKEEKITVFTQSEFVKALNEGVIKTADVVAEADAVLSVRGTFDRKVYLQKKGGDVIPLTPAVNSKTDAKTKSEPPARYTTRLIKSDALWDALVAKSTVNVEDDNSGFWRYIFGGIVVPLLLLIGVVYFFSVRQMRGGKGAMDFGKSRARMIPPDELHVKFDDIAGADEAKEEISEIVEYLRDPLRFQLVGGQIPKGCLLVGNPGTGKTLMAKAVACEAGVPFFSISGSDFVEMFVGVGASRVRDMFEQARKHTPCLIFIDEIDAVGRSRFSGWGGGHDEREQTLNAMLVEMDGLESRAGVIVLAATNRPDVLDPALLRPGRFDRQVVMDLPDIKGRRQILDVHIKKIKVDESIDLDVIARTTPGFSGADLANLCNEAALLAARRNQEAVTQSDLEEARDKVSYGTERRSRKITERERKLTAYHEAGHALIALHNSYCTPVHKVTIIPRGQAYLGATFTMPKEDVYTRSKLELEAEMAMTMGGRVAEELVIGDITTGASADIMHLTAIARRMVCMYGMSEKVGPIKYGDIQAQPRVRIDVPPEDPCSQETAREIDLEIRRLSQQALDAARSCLREHADELEKLAQALLERETISIAEIRELLGLKDPDAVEVPEEPAAVVPQEAENAAAGDSL